ncbi:MAG: glutathione S-transferase N-terminal domain-containing protein [Gammaproteobacteria bacterium]
MTLKIYGSPASPFVRKVRIVLVEKSIAHEFVEDSPSQPGSRVPALNPLGKIPVVEPDDGAVLFDSPLIVEYLELVKPSPALLGSGMERIAIKRWEALADGICDAAVLTMAERRRPDPALRSQAWMDLQRGKIERAIGAMARELGTRGSCHGTQFSLADIAACVALGYVDFRLPEIPWRAQHANLVDLMARHAARAAFVATAPTG